MVSHSIYCCVNGGTDLAVATAMQSKKSAGASYNNGASATNVSQVVIVPYSNQPITVLFDRPDVITMGITISVTVVQPVQNPIDAVKQAIINYATGLLDGFAGLVVGANVSPWELGGAVTSQYPGIYVQSLQIQQLLPTPGSLQYTEYAITPWQIAEVLASNIIVTVL